MSGSHDRAALDFERERPPVLTQEILEEELERRRRNRQTALLALSGILLEACFLLTAILARHVFPLLAAVCAGYVICSSTGGGILAVVYSVRRRELLCREQI